MDGVQFERGGSEVICASVLETVGTRANSRIVPRISDRGATTLMFEGLPAPYERSEQ